jgi:LysR family nitrogen assimilation transcriptional regulator
MTLVQLANFIRIAELQSLTKAAAVIRVAQPALSRQIRNLEEELGSILLVRHAWGVTLTAAGEVLLVHARRLVLETENARDAVLEVAAVPAGRVALGLPSSLATALIPPLSLAIRDRYPNLRVHFVDGFSAVLHRRALADELDLAILYEDRVIGPLATTPLLSEALVLVGPPDAEVSTRTPSTMLAGRTLILPAAPNRLRLIVDEALALGDGAQGPIVEVDSLPAIIEIVRSGGGFTVLPYSSVAPAVVRGDVQTWAFRTPAPTRTLLLVRRLDRRPTVGVDAVEAEIRRLVTSLAGDLGWTVLCS